MVARLLERDAHASRMEAPQGYGVAVDPGAKAWSGSRSHRRDPGRGENAIPSVIVRRSGIPARINKNKEELTSDRRRKSLPMLGAMWSQLAAFVAPAFARDEPEQICDDEIIVNATTRSETHPECERDVARRREHRGCLTFRRRPYCPEPHARPEPGIDPRGLRQPGGEATPSRFRLPVCRSAGASAGGWFRGRPGSG